MKSKIPKSHLILFAGIISVANVGRLSATDRSSGSQKIITTGVGIDFVLIPKGSFERIAGKKMDTQFPGAKNGSERVEFQSFRMSSTEVSWAQWQNVFGKKVTENFVGRPLKDEELSLPVAGVCYFEILVFCELLSNRLRSDDGFVGSALLPTEGQWEYVARMGGNKLNGENIRREDSPDPEVWRCGSGGRSDLGVYDMLGNVSEICRDVFVQKPPTGLNPKTIAIDDVSKLMFVVRGGSFLKDTSCADFGYRVAVPPNYRSPDTGFRIVWESGL